MTNNINTAKIYTDVQGVQNLHGQMVTDLKGTTHEVAQQFEALMMQMVVKSMRDANQAFASSSESNQQMDMYQDLFDKQLSLTMSTGPNGFAAMIEKNMAERAGMADEPAAAEAMPKPLEAPNKAPASTSHQSVKFPSAEHFVQGLWAGAKMAAHAIGADPAIILAQAALETDWGKKIIPGMNGQSGHNLFNIKATPDWKAGSTSVATLEQKEGVLVKEKASFRDYGSFEESFSDFVGLLKNNGRFRSALKNASDPAKFVQSLQENGYATDPHYAAKILNIFRSPKFQQLVQKML